MINCVHKSFLSLSNLNKHALNVLVYAAVVEIETFSKYLSSQQITTEKS